MPKAQKSVKYAVLPVTTVRALNVRDAETIIDAQNQVDDDMLSALEDMINSAKAGKLASADALSSAALAW